MVGHRCLPPESLLAEAAFVRWMRTHPRATDWMVVLACAGLQEAVLLFGGEPAGWAGQIFVIFAAVLIQRRRHPFAVLVATTTAAVVATPFLPGLAQQRLPQAFALYTVAANQGAGMALMGYTMTVGAAFLTGTLVMLGGGSRFSPSILDPLGLAVLAAGFLIRARRERRESLTELIRQRVEHVALTERSRITAEMHDVVAHSVTVMLALAGGARVAWEKHPERARDALENLNEVGVMALHEMQRILRILRTKDVELDAALETSGHNVESLDELARTFRAAGLPVTLSRSGPVEMNDPALETTIHRMVKEALTNALRYAQDATEVRVRIDTGPEAIDVTVTDNGRPVAPSPSIGGGVGLTGIRERAAAFGGTSEAGPLRGGGWRTHARIPLRQESET